MSTNTTPRPVLLLRFLVVATGVLVMGLSSQEVRRSIESNETPPSPEDVVALRAQIEAAKASSLRDAFNLFGKSK